jgi:hypothetical protein
LTRRALVGVLAALACLVADLHPWIFADGTF